MHRKLIHFSILALAAGLSTWGYVKLSERKHPNVLVVLLDTLRADHLGAYGYERNTSPFLDSFAAENIKFNFAVTAAPWTPPSVASIFTGKYATSHGFFPPNSREEARQGHSVLGRHHDTLAEIFQRSGYATAAVSPNPWITRDFKFDQGFDEFAYFPRAAAGKINAAAKKFITKLKDQSKPFFLYLHYLDPHDPYAPPADYASLFQGPLAGRDYSEPALRSIGLYDGEIRYLDGALKRLFDFLKEQGLYEDLLVVIVADHGEQFQEHGFSTHGYTVYNVETHVPLLLKLPGKPRRKVVDHTVSTIDIFPTLLDSAGIRYEKGSSLAVSLLDDVKQRERGGVMSAIKRKLKQRAFVTPDGIKLIIGGTYDGDPTKSCDPHSNIVGVFNSRIDYQEKAALANCPDLPQMQAELGDTLHMARLLKGEDSGLSDPLTDDAINQLRSLGYLQ